MRVNFSSHAMHSQSGKLQALRKKIPVMNQKDGTSLSFGGYGYEQLIIIN